MKRVILFLLLLLPFFAEAQGSKQKAVLKDTIGSYLTGKRFAIKGYIKNKQTLIHKDDDYLWFREDGILEMAVLGNADRAHWSWDTTKKAIVVKYNDGKSTEWALSFNSEIPKAFNETEEYKLKEDVALSTISAATGDKGNFCKSWLIAEHKSGSTKVEYKYMDYMRMHGNGVYEQSTNGKYLRGTWTTSEDGKKLTITINKKVTEWTVTEWKKDKLYMEKGASETMILKPETIVKKK